MIRPLDEEEEYFQDQNRKESRKERIQKSNKDRSKYKKSDQKKESRKTYTPGSGDLYGRVLSITGEGIKVQADKKDYLCTLKGSLKMEKTKNKNLIAVGDFVFFRKDGVITHVDDRRSLLERIDVSGRKKQIIAANIDQVFITASVVMPPLKPFLIDRYIIAARRGNMEPVVIINKIDLFNSKDPEVLEQKRLYESFLEAYQGRNIKILSVSSKKKKNINAIEKLMEKKASLFSGQSGTGKSSLINQILGLDLPVKEVREKTLKGVHTTTKAVLIPLTSGGFCIDTPGIKSFGIWELTREEILEHFIEIQEMGKQCKFADCTHLNEPHCAVQEAVDEGMIHPLIYDSYTALMMDIFEKKLEEFD